MHTCLVFDTRVTHDGGNVPFLQAEAQRKVSEGKYIPHRQIYRVNSTRRTSTPSSSSQAAHRASLGAPIFILLYNLHKSITCLFCVIYILFQALCAHSVNVDFFVLFCVSYTLTIHV